MFDARDGAGLAAGLDIAFPRLDRLPDPKRIERVASLIAASHRAAADGRLEEAYQLAVGASEALPKIVDGHAQRARVAVQTGLAAEGLDAARTALAIDPASMEMLMLAGACAYHAGRLREAAAFCVQVLDLDEGEQTKNFPSMAHYYLGNALDDLGQSYAGITHLEIARESRPDAAQFHNDTGLAYRHIGEPEVALSCFAQGLELSGTDANLLANFGAAALEVGDAVRSGAAVQRLARHHPDHPSIAVLMEAARRWQAEGGEPPQLVPRIPSTDVVGTVHCTECPCRIPLAGEHDVLCAACGAKRSMFVQVCGICGSDGSVAPMVLPSVCPYCRMGELVVEP